MRKLWMRRAQGTVANHATAVPPPAVGFRLVRYFTAASLAAFVLVAAPLLYLQRLGDDFFRQVLGEQSLYFKPGSLCCSTARCS